MDFWAGCKRLTTNPSRQSALNRNERPLAAPGASTCWSGLDDTAYATTPRGLAPHRAGAHSGTSWSSISASSKGWSASHIDYDARRRDETIEHSRDAAAAAIRSIIRTLETSRELLPGENHLGPDGGRG